jgi:hypothetical protein
MIMSQRGCNMGLFDSMKKTKELNKKAEWKQGIINTVIEFNPDHMKLTTATQTDVIFYKDIMSVQQATFVVNIKTNVKTYSLMSRKKRGSSEKAAALTQQIIEYMNQNK